MLGHKLDSYSSRLILTVAVVLALSGCGDDSGGSSQSASAVEISPPPPPTDIVVGDKYFYRPKLADGTGAVVYSISSLPSWATFDSSNGALSGSPSESDVGDSADIAITVTEVQADSASADAQDDQTAAATSNTTSTTPTAPMTAAAANGTTTASSGTAADSNATHSNLKSRHGNIGPFRIRVRPKTQTAPTNNPPTIGGTPATADMAGQAYSFTPTASDSDGNTLLFSIVNRPSWAKFDTTTGVLSGTPAATDAGMTSKIVISVTDGSTTVSLPAFSIQVTAPANTGPITRPANAAPTISGSSITTVTAGSAYSFTPTAKDSDSTALTFSIQNKPAWATFSTTTGQLVGTPASTNVGSYAGVIISVSDGQTSASLPAFTVNVTAAATPTATVAWIAPTQNTDGSALTDLAGYRIYYGTSASALNQTITINNAGITTYVIDNLGSGTWYFAVKAVDTTGLESDLSAVGSKTIS
jgi:hypothetical protein